MRFEAVPTITGGEVFDTVLNRVIDMRPSFEAARFTAARLNRLTAGESERRVARLLAQDLS